MRSDKRSTITLLIFSAVVLLSLVLTLTIRAESLALWRVWLPIIFKSDPSHSSPYLDNPDFEEGKVGWFFYSTQGGDDIITVAPEPRGYYSARLGSNVENYREAYISQQATVPTEKPWLTFWHYVDSQEDYCPQFTRYDYVSIQIDGTEVHSLPLCDDADHPNHVWLKQAVYLGNYAGMTVYIKIFFHSDGTLPTDYYVDDFDFE